MTGGGGEQRPRASRVPGRVVCNRSALEPRVNAHSMAPSSLRVVREHTYVAVRNQPRMLPDGFMTLSAKGA